MPLHYSLWLLKQPDKQELLDVRKVLQAASIFDAARLRLCNNNVAGQKQAIHEINLMPKRRRFGCKCDYRWGNRCKTSCLSRRSQRAGEV